MADQPDDFKIFPGMAGTARFPDGKLHETAAPALEIPLAALFRDAKGKDGVWVIDAQKLTIARRQVKVGTLTENGVMVLDGLKPGELIVSAGVDSLKNGQAVRILQPANFATD